MKLYHQTNMVCIFILICLITLILNHASQAQDYSSSSQDISQEQFEEQFQKQLQRAIESGVTDPQELQKIISQASMNAPIHCLTKEELLEKGNIEDMSPQNAREQIQMSVEYGALLPSAINAFDQGLSECRSLNLTKFPQKENICSYATYTYIVFEDGSKHMSENTKELYDPNLLTHRSEQYMQKCKETDIAAFTALGANAPKSGDLMLVSQDSTIFWTVYNGIIIHNHTSLADKKTNTNKAYFAVAP